MTKENICTGVLKILNEKIGITAEILTENNFDKPLTENNFDKPLTGKTFSMDEISLTYLFLEVEKEFEISVPFEKIKNYGFNTINDIVKIVFELSNEKL